MKWMLQKLAAQAHCVPCCSWKWDQVSPQNQHNWKSNFVDKEVDTVTARAFPAPIGSHLITTVQECMIRHRVKQAAWQSMTKLPARLSFHLRGRTLLDRVCLGSPLECGTAGSCNLCPRCMGNQLRRRRCDEPWKLHSVHETIQWYKFNTLLTEPSNTGNSIVVIQVHTLTHALIRACADQQTFSCCDISDK